MTDIGNVITTATQGESVNTGLAIALGEGNTTTKADLFNRAKDAIGAGDRSLRDAAEAFALAREDFEASQREIAEAVGMSPANAMAGVQTGHEVVLPERMPSVLTEPKYTAKQIEKDCPAQLHDLAKEITERLEKFSEHEKLAIDEVIVVNELIAKVKALCDVGGFTAFRETFFPNLAKSRVYELLAIGTNKKSFGDVKASTRARVAKHRANKAATSNSVTVTDKSQQELEARGTSEEHGEVEAPSFGSEQTPEPTKPGRGIAPGDEVTPKFTTLVLELDRRTYKRPPEHFSGTKASGEIIARLAKLFTDIVNIKMSEAVEAAPTMALLDNGDASAAKQSVEDMKPAAEGSHQ
jgi:hypothetical protein